MILTYVALWLLVILALLWGIDKLRISKLEERIDYIEKMRRCDRLIKEVERQWLRAVPDKFVGTEVSGIEQNISLRTWKRFNYDYVYTSIWPLPFTNHKDFVKSMDKLIDNNPVVWKPSKKK